jgi:ribosomal protein S27AE
MNSEDRCPRCGEGTLRNWRELSDEQQEVVKRLPGSADYASADREARHRWCPRCWFESTEGEPREA